MSVCVCVCVCVCVRACVPGPPLVECQAKQQAVVQEEISVPPMMP